MVEEGKNAEEIMEFAGYKSLASLARFYVLQEEKRIFHVKRDKAF